MVAAVQKPCLLRTPARFSPLPADLPPAGGGGSNGGSGSSSGGAPSTSSSAPEPAQVSLPGMVHLSQVSPPSSFNFQAADQWDRWLRRQYNVPGLARVEVKESDVEKMPFPFQEPTRRQQSEKLIAMKNINCALINMFKTIKMKQFQNVFS